MVIMLFLQRLERKKRRRIIQLESTGPLKKKMPMREYTRVQRRNGVQEIEKNLALSAANGFCKEHGYSMKKLEEKRLYLFDEEALFAVPSEMKPDGLKNDMATLPIPVLVLKRVDGKIVVEPTKHTEKCLK